VADIELEVSFGSTKGLPNYSSERADQRIRMTISIDGDTVEEQLNELVKYENILHNHLVYAVAEALQLEAGLSEGGHVSLIWPEPPAPAAAAPVAPQPSAPAPQGGGGGSGAGPRTPPKATKEEYAALPRLHMDMGDGLKVYVDQRPLKLAGKYQATAPDFKVDQRDGQGYWIKDQNGVLVLHVAQAMQNAGVT
jgi:hypothetical protein